MPVRELTPQEIDDLQVQVGTGGGLTVRELTPKERHDFPLLKGAVNAFEQGVDWDIRFKIKNLAANPAAARLYLEGLGYEVRPYGTGFNFAVRKNPQDKFSVVDPAGFDSQDILDFSYDAIGGTVTSKLGAVGAGALGGALIGGPVGAVIGGTLGLLVGGMLTEYARQRIGAHLGIPENSDPETILFVGVASAIAPSIGRVLGATSRATLRPAANYVSRKMIRPIGHAAAELGAGLARISGRPELSAGEALIERAAMARGERLLSPSEVGELLTKRVGLVLSGKTPERKTVEAILKATDKTIDLNPVFAKMENIGRTLTQSPVDGASAEKLTVELQQKLLNLLGYDADLIDNPGAMKAIFRKVPAEIADQIQRRLGKESNFVNDFGIHIRNDFTKGARQARHILTSQMKDKLGPTYSQLQSKIHAKLSVAQQIERRIGKMIEDLGTDPRAESFISNFSGKNKTALRKMVEKFDRLNGTDFTELARRAVIGSAFSGGAGLPFGTPSFRPNLTVTGSLMGAAMATNLLGVTGPGAYAAAPLGFVMASQGGMVGTARGVQGLARGLARTGAGIGRTLDPQTAQVMAAIQAAVRERQAQRNTVGTRVTR